MPRKTIKDLNEEIIVLKARLEWTQGVNKALITLLDTTSSYLTELKANLRVLHSTADKAGSICKRTLSDVKEAIRGKGEGTTD